MVFILVMPGTMVWLNAEEIPALKGARIRFDHLSWDFGTVVEGAIVEHAFPFQNAGGETLVITDVHASCGCTKSGTTKDLILPGETAAVFVEFNSMGKRGDIVKTVFVSTNAPDSAEIQLTIDIRVVEDTAKSIAVPVQRDTTAVRKHADDTPIRAMSMMNMPARKPGQSIFDSACRPCHVDPAVGKFGADLYEAACAMCHGSDSHPVVHGAAAITAGKYLVGKPLSYYRDMISKGTGSPMMPGFSDQHGGPLTEEQIRSLVNYFARIKISGHPAHYPPRFVEH